jgi:hypothetical protein
MIIDNTYFINELYIPHAKPSVTSDVVTVDSQLNSFINKYERDCLVRCLGLKLYNEFISNIDVNQKTLIKTTSDDKWNKLLNGGTYTINNDDFEWRGLRFKNSDLDAKPNRSLIANYVFWHFESNNDSYNTGNGNVRPKAKNADKVSASLKVVKSWNEMVEMIQGKEINQNVIYSRFGIGLDYYQDSTEVDLYKFIEDSNTILEDTYPNFKPNYWRESLNEMGI